MAARAEAVLWLCSGCGETLHGLMTDDGFISDKELLEQPADMRAEGCYLCACPAGEVVGHDDELAGDS